MKLSLFTLQGPKLYSDRGHYMVRELITDMKEKGQLNGWRLILMMGILLKTGQVTG